MTLQEMLGVPVQNADDDSCAIEWIIRECKEFPLDIDGEALYEQVAGSLAHAIRSYLAKSVAA